MSDRRKVTRLARGYCKSPGNCCLLLTFNAIEQMALWILVYASCRRGAIGSALVRAR
jgi:hypothetical protein